MEVSVMQSAYQLLRAKSEPAVFSKALFGVGGVDYGSGGAFRSLPGTREEIRNLQAIAKTANWTIGVKTGAEVSKEAVVQGLLSSSVIHLATHGFLPPSGSVNHAVAGVALSGANAGNAGRLFSGDVVKLDLRRARLVTVSACVSGAGTPVDGQGVIGFQTSFTAAGVRTLLASLWNVPDRPTAILMSEFYKGWMVDGLTMSAALRRAQQTVKEIPEYAAMVNWGAWTLVGEGW